MTGTGNQVANTGYPFDPKLRISPYQRIAVVGGSWRDMGRQYVAQCKQGFLARCADAYASFVMSVGDPAVIADIVDRYTIASRNDFPQMIELMEGMAQEAGVSFDQVVLLVYGKSMLRAETESEGAFADVAPECSECAAWGDATKDGHLVSAVNMDLGYETREYLPATLAYPEDGVPFIAGELFHRFGMNAAGVLMQGSGAQNYGPLGMIKPTREAPRHMWNEMSIRALAYSHSAQEAYDLYMEWPLISGVNQLFADKGHDVFLMEAVAGKHMLRRAGDVGETGQYLIENNGAHHPQMQDTKRQDFTYWDDVDPRYWSVERHLQDAMGNITMDTMFAAESEMRYYIPAGWSLIKDEEAGVFKWREGSQDPYTAGWHDCWDTMYHGNWSPQIHAGDFGPVLRAVMDGDEFVFCMMKGSSYPEFSLSPNTLGTFWKVKLCDNPRSVCNKAKAELQEQIWRAARDIHLSRTQVAQERIAALNEAKTLMYEAMNYMSLAVVGEAESGACDKSYNLYGEALSAFCGGQCYARCAQDKPQEFCQDPA